MSIHIRGFVPLRARALTSLAVMLAAGVSIFAVPLYKATPIGPKMKEVDVELAEQKSAFPRSEVVFGNLPTGIDKVFVNGQLVWDSTKPTGARPGRVLELTHNR